MPLAIRQRQALRWSFEGYRGPVDLGALGPEVTLITPASTVAALRAGYVPAWSPVISGSTDR